MTQRAAIVIEFNWSGEVNGEQWHLFEQMDRVANLWMEENFLPETQPKAWVLVGEVSDEVLGIIAQRSAEHPEWNEPPHPQPLTHVLREDSDDG